MTTQRLELAKNYIIQRKYETAKILLSSMLDNLEAVEWLAKIEDLERKANSANHYKYKMVQVPPRLEVETANQKAHGAADYLESIVNTMAEYGWEFYRIDTIGVRVQPGCLGVLLGQQTDWESYYVITFRKLAELARTSSKHTP